MVKVENNNIIVTSDFGFCLLSLDTTNKIESIEFIGCSGKILIKINFFVVGTKKDEDVFELQYKSRFLQKNRNIAYSDYKKLCNILGV